MASANMKTVKVATIIGYFQNRRQAEIGAKPGLANSPDSDVLAV